MALFLTEEETAVSKLLRISPIFYFKRRDTNLNLHQEYLSFLIYMRYTVLMQFLVISSV